MNGILTKRCYSQYETLSLQGQSKYAPLGQLLLFNAIHYLYQSSIKTDTAAIAGTTLYSQKHMGCMRGYKPRVLC